MQKRLMFDEPDVSVEQAAAPVGYAGIYGFHKYWGKKPHEPIAYAIQQLTKPGDIVVDPFLGSGSSAREAMVRNRRFIGFDVNPVAVELATFISAPPKREAVRAAIEIITKDVKSKIHATYALGSGETATHYLWDGKDLKEVWIKGSAKLARRELKPTRHDFALIESFNSYRSRLVQTPRFFSNGRINASPEMNLDSLLTPRAQHNLDLLIESVSASPPSVRKALQLCLTAASGQMSRMVFAVTGRGKTKGESAEKVEVGSWVIGYWRPRLHFEVNVWNCFENRARKLLAALKEANDNPKIPFGGRPEDVVEKKATCFVGVMDCRKGLERLPSGSCTLVITDPPHSDRVPYLELSEFWNSILGKVSNLKDEIVISNAKERAKTEDEYQNAMSNFLSQATRVLEPDGSLVVFFNARQTDSWAAISKLIRTPAETGLSYDGKFPCNYSANSVVQDNRKGALKHDWALVFSKGSSRRLAGGGHRLSNIPGWSADFPAIIASSPNS